MEDTDEIIDECFENSQIYEDAIIDWALTDGANEFLWTDAFQRAYEKWLVEGDEE